MFIPFAIPVGSAQLGAGRRHRRDGADASRAREDALGKRNARGGSWACLKKPAAWVRAAFGASPIRGSTGRELFAWCRRQSCARREL